MDRSVMPKLSSIVVNILASELLDFFVLVVLFRVNYVLLLNS